MLQYLFALLPVAATCGWYMGSKKSDSNTKRRSPFKMRHDYFKGLNYLINEQPDKAVDVFIKLLEVDGDTVETHLALGNLFRRRGEVERATRIHQNIIARPNLAAQHRLQALSELGQDYLKAGVLDRAERLFVELIELGQSDLSSYQFLLTIYQQEKDWVKAIDIARKTQGLGKPMGLVIAQYCCELAEQYLEQGNLQQVQLFLKKAQSYHFACIRAHLIRARLEVEQGNDKNAIHYYKKVIHQELIFLPEFIDSMIACYQRLNAEDEMFAYFSDCLKKHSHVALVLAIADYLRKKSGNSAAIEFVASEMQRSPSPSGLKYLVSNYLKDSGDQLGLVSELIEKLLDKQVVYRCMQCGFPSKRLFWLCPSCHQWETIKPVQEKKESV